MRGFVQSIGRFAQKVYRTGCFVSTGEQCIALCDTVTDSRCVRKNLPPGFKGLFFPCRQPGGIDLLHLIAQQIDTALFFRFIGDHGVQFPFDLHKLAV